MTKQKVFIWTSMEKHKVLWYVTEAMNTSLLYSMTTSSTVLCFQNTSGIVILQCIIKLSNMGTISQYCHWRRKGTDTPCCENEDSTLTSTAGFKPADYKSLS
jgi:hypothetical protein